MFGKKKPTVERTPFAGISKLGDFELEFSVGKGKTQKLTVLNVEIGVGIESEISLFEIDKPELIAIEMAFDHAMQDADFYEDFYTFNVSEDEDSIQKRDYVVKILPVKLTSKDFLQKRHFVLSLMITTNPGDTKLTTEQIMDLRVATAKAKRHAISIAQKLRDDVISIFGDRHGMRFEDGGVRCFQYD